MRVGVLGPLLVVADGRDVTPRGQRLRDVLTVLVQRRGRPVPAEVVFDLVWTAGRSRPNAPAAPVTAVHTTIARLRRQLGADAIQTSDAGYRVSDALTTDEDAFAGLAVTARGHLNRGEIGPAIAAFREALAHWRGTEAFDGVSEDLVLTDRARLAELWARAAEDLASTLLDHQDASDPGEALHWATTVLQRHPLRERAWQLAMLAAYRDHRTADALALYGTLCRRLRDDLGIDPSAASVRLHTRILRADPSLRHVSSVEERGSGDATARRAGPPAPVTPLIGRTAEMSDLIGALEVGRRLVTLTGPGGVGKSRVLVELGARRRATDRMVYVELAGWAQSGVDDLAEAIAVAHGASAAGQESLRSLTSVLGGDDWLLLLDEAEEVARPLAVVVQTLLDHCPRVRIVVTSRRPLGVQDETLQPIGPLACPAEGASVAAILDSPGVLLLVSRLADLAVSEAADESAAETLATIARRVDGLPLAIELLAGQAMTRSLAELAELALFPLDIAATAPPRSARHRSLRDAIAWSIDRVDAVSRTVLLRLGVFAGRFDIAAARVIVGHVDGNVHDAVLALVRDALVHVERVDTDHIAFRLLSTVRELVVGELTPAELAAARRRHFSWHADRWRGDPLRDDVIADVREHFEDYLEALQRAIDADDAGAVSALSLTLTRFWLYAGGRASGVRWLTRVLDSELLDPHERARAFTQRAALAVHHDMRLVRDDTSAAIPILLQHDDASWLVTARTTRALGLDAAGASMEAIACADAAVDGARAVAPGKLLEVLAVQAKIHAGAGSAEVAAAAIAESRVLLPHTASAAIRIVVCVDLACALLDLGRASDSLGMLDDVRAETTRILGRRPPGSYTLATGWAALACGNFDRALTMFGAELPPSGAARADQRTVESALGAAHALHALGAGAGGPVIERALELAKRIGYAPSPGARLACGQALSAGGAAGSTPPAIDPDDVLARGIVTDLGAALADRTSSPLRS